MRVLVIDNYDSFVYNLVQYLGQLGAGCEVRRNDEITVADISGIGPDAILLSPGPGTPERAGICMGVIRECGPHLPILGVCLGHQAFGAAYGGTVTRAPELLHGKTSQVHHGGVGVLAGRPPDAGQLAGGCRLHRSGRAGARARGRGRGPPPGRVRGLTGAAAFAAWPAAHPHDRPPAPGAWSRSAARAPRGQPPGLPDGLDGGGDVGGVWPWLL